MVVDLEALAYIMNAGIITQRANTGQYVCFLDGIWLKDSVDAPSMRGACGFGPTPKESAEDLAGSIRGKVAFVQGVDGARHFFPIPDTLVVGNLGKE